MIPTRALGSGEPIQVHRFPSWRRVLASLGVHFAVFIVIAILLAFPFVGVFANGTQALVARMEALDDPKDRARRLSDFKLLMKEWELPALARKADARSDGLAFEATTGCAAATEYTWAAEQGYSARLIRSPCLTDSVGVSIVLATADSPEPTLPDPLGDGTSTGLWGRRIGIISWVQGSAVYRLSMVSEPGATMEASMSRCAQSVRDLSAHIEGARAHLRLTSSGDFVKDGMLGVITTWMIFVLPFRLVALRRVSWRGPPTGPDAVDLTSRAIKTMAVMRSKPWIFAALAFASLMAFGLPLSANSALLGWVTGAGIVLVWAVVVRAYWRHRSRWAIRRVRQALESNARGVIGSALVRAAHFFAYTMLLGWVVIGFASLLGPSVPPEVEVLAVETLMQQGTFWTSVLGLALLCLLTIGAAGPSAIGLLTLIPMALLYVLWRVGLRLSFASARATLDIDPRPPIVMLRNFEEDGLRVQAVYTRSGIMSLVSPIRSRTFEELLASRLSQWGPVIAISRPGARVRHIGAARESFSDAEWQQAVGAWCSRALVVLVSGTPAGVTNGYQWELSYVDSDLKHQRLMVVVPPRRPRATAARSLAFQAMTLGMHAFTGAHPQGPRDGTQVIARASSTGWMRFGSRVWNDLSYSMAIDSAITVLLPYWEAELAASSSLPPATD